MEGVNCKLSSVTVGQVIDHRNEKPSCKLVQSPQGRFSFILSTLCLWQNLAGSCAICHCHSFVFLGDSPLKRGANKDAANACHEAPELASSRDELLEKYGKVKFELESGIDEASAFFKLTKAAVMQHDETCKLFWLSICAKMMKSREKRSAFVLSEEWRNFQDYHQHPTGQFHNQFVSRSPLLFFSKSHYLGT